MKFFVCVAGLPHEVLYELEKRSAARFTEEKDNKPIMKAVREPYSYRDGMCDAYLDELATRFRNLSPREDVSVILAYVDYGREVTSRFLRNFFPFALSAPVDPFYPNVAPKNERRKELTRYADEIERTAKRLRNRARVVRDVLSGQNFTPLLLPIRNFHSNVLASRMDTLFDSLGTIEDIRAELDDAVREIKRRHPLKKLPGFKPFFQDNRALRFASPGKDRHGMARGLGDGHRHFCLIGSRVRLGGPFDPLFHYDCDYERREVDNTYPNCHGVESKPAAKTHVNIAPNDAIR